MTNNPVTDHLGQTFKTFREMAEYWHINENTLRSRCKKMGIKDALTTSLSKSYHHYREVPFQGKIYSSLKELCDDYGASYERTKIRLRRGWSLELALTDCNALKVESIDHLGIHYTSLREMTSKYGIKPCTYISRLNRGWSKRDALTISIKDKRYKNLKVALEFLPELTDILNKAITQENKILIQAILEQINGNSKNTL